MVVSRKVKKQHAYTFKLIIKTTAYIQLVNHAHDHSKTVTSHYSLIIIDVTPVELIN